ncbi:MAG: cytochrome c biogenesis CcdA family protein [Micromonosporaceae bacterium]
MTESLALALAAGVLAAVNPCGFALLPAYLSFLIVGDSGGTRRAALGRALLMTTAMTSGFVLVFGGFGLLVAPVAPQLQQHLPWVTVVIGVVLIGVGGWLLAGRSLPVFLPRPSGGTPTSSFTSMVVFGASYALASLSCTVAPFVFIVVSAFQAGTVVTGFGLFLAYAAGMGLVVGSVALAVALARMSLLTRVRRMLPYVTRVGGLLLVLAGGYVAYYGWYELRVLGGDLSDDPVVDIGTTLQTWASNTLSGIGVLPVAAVFLVLLAGAAGLTLWSRSRAAAPAEDPLPPAAAPSAPPADTPPAVAAPAAAAEPQDRDLGNEADAG